MKGHARVAVYSLLLNSLLMVVKYYLGVISGSLALQADAVHSLADVVSALTMVLGILIANRKTKTFPSGLYKVENLVALISSFFIFFAAYEIGMDAWFGHSVGHIEKIPVVLIGIAFIILVAFLFSRYELKVGLEVGSPSLVADAKHVTTDLLSTFVILFGVVGAYFGYHIDRYIAILVAILVARIGIRILLDSLKVLLDATLDYQTLDAIRKILESRSDVTEVLLLGGRSSGRFKFVEATLRIDVRLLREAHTIIAHLEEEILDRFPSIDKLLIQYEPEQKEFLTAAAPLEVAPDSIRQEESKLSDHFGNARYFAFLLRDVRSGNVSIKGYEPNPFLELERHKGVRVAEFLAKKEIDEVWVRTDTSGTGAGYALEAMEVDVVTTEARTVRELIELMENQY
jgi:cation diffusion facilitator family transporter